MSNRFNPNGDMIFNVLSGLGKQVGGVMQHQNKQAKLKGLLDRVNDGDETAIDEAFTEDPQLGVFLNQRLQQGQVDLARFIGPVAERAMSFNGDPAAIRSFLKAQMEGAPKRIQKELLETINMSDAEMLNDIDVAYSGWKRMSGSTQDPSSVREYQFFNSLKPEEQKRYLAMKRANPTFKMGDVTMQGDQMDGTATPFAVGDDATQADIQETITEQQADKAEQLEAGKQDAKTVSTLGADVMQWETAKEGLAAAFPEVESILKQAPGSSLSNIASTILSKAIGNTKSQDAQAKISQVGAMLLQSVPIPPGPQSEAELIQRKYTIGQLEDPNISVSAKKELIDAFFKFQDAKAAASKREIEKIQGGKVEAAQPSNKHTSSSGISFTVE